MILVLSAICITVMGLLILFWMNRINNDRKMDQHTITAEALHALLASNQEVRVFDVRLPLDLLAHTEIISGAQRISPEEIIENPSLIPKEKESVVYCTCPNDKTNRAILRRALDMRFFRVKLLKGGLEAWKAKGYPVEPYLETFHLSTPELSHPSDRESRQR